MLLQSPEIDNLTFILPITRQNRQIAKQFAIGQATKEKAEQVWLNTLAVLVVNNYLTMLGIDTDLAKSDSWNRVMQITSNVADLEIVGVGKLECRPIKNSDSNCFIPPEVKELRIGYLVIKIDDSYKKATIMGFVPQVATAELAINSLNPPEMLIDRIHELKESRAANSMVHLNRWLDNVFEAGWQTVESLLTPERLTPAFGFRRVELLELNILESRLKDNRVSRAKLIDLGIQFGERQVVLLLEINIESDGNIGVTVQVHPAAPNIYLPKKLELKVLEKKDVVFMEAQARSKDNYIQLQFSGQTEETFIVEIILDDIKFSEHFKL